MEVKRLNSSESLLLDDIRVLGTKEMISRWAPVAIAWIYCCCFAFFLAKTIMSGTHGVFVYPLDDSYIHLAMAKNLVRYHVWGLGPDVFASASSSPGWTLILAITDAIFGLHLLLPVFLNLLFALGILLAVNHGFSAFAPRASAWSRFFAMALIVTGTPLPSLVILGMEHVAQTLSILLLLILAAQILATQPSQAIPPRLRVMLLLTAVFAGCIRYEAVLAVFPVFVLLAWRRRYTLAALVAAFSALGPISFALYSHHISGFWLPFSVLTKASQHSNQLSRLRWVVGLFIGQYSENMPFFGAIVLTYFARLRSRSFWDPIQLFLALTATVVAAHILFAPIGWLMRYESYCVCLILFGLSLTLSQLNFPAHPREFILASAWRDNALRGLILLSILVSLYGLFQRAWSGAFLPEKAAIDRFDEHIQMAKFISSAYDHDTIVVNDIGAVAFFSAAHLLDLTGLGSPEPLLARRRHSDFTANDVEQWANSANASIAILQPQWPLIAKITPPDWTLVEEWQIPRNVVFGDNLVGFYAIKPTSIDRLCNALNGFPLSREDRIVINHCSLHRTP